MVQALAQRYIARFGAEAVALWRVGSTSNLPLRVRAWSAFLCDRI